MGFLRLIENHSGACTCITNITSSVNSLEGVAVLTYSLQILLAVVSQRECDMLPGSIEAILPEQLPVAMACVIKCRYFWSVLRSHISDSDSTGRLGDSIMAYSTTSQEVSRESS